VSGGGRKTLDIWNYKGFATKLQSMGALLYDNPMSCDFSSSRRFLPAKTSLFLSDYLIAAGVDGPSRLLRPFGGAFGVG
jgi:hypothetical protein